MLRADVLPHVARLNEELAGAGIPLAILAGSEIQVTDSAAYRREWGGRPVLPPGRRSTFTLLEFNWKPEQYPADAAELVGWLRARGMTRSSPTRSARSTDDPERVASAGRAGAWLQVNGRFRLLATMGPAPRSSGESLLRTYPEIVLAIRCSQPAPLFGAVGRICVGARAASAVGAYRRPACAADQVLGLPHHAIHVL